MSEARGPDFLGIGAPRCATTTLHTVLASHPQIWLPPVKEMHYFDVQRQGGRKPGHRRKFRRTLKQAVMGRGRWHDVAWHWRYLRSEVSDDAYCRWFTGHGDRLAGEITPAYSILPPATIAELARWRSDLKVILMLRDPLERIRSAQRFQEIKKNRTVPWTDPDGYLALAHEQRAIERSRYNDILAAWESAFPTEQIFVGFAEELARDPAALFERLMAFLGVAATWPEAAASTATQRNRTGKGPEVPPMVEAPVAAELIDDTHCLAERFPWPARDWLARQEALLERAG